MRVITDARGLADTAGCTFVPTMGALHEGHLALVRQARLRPAPVVVSIFVNPTQFGAGEDLDRYPRTVESDLEAAAGAGADAVFAPSTEVVYPPDDSVEVPDLPAIATEPGLEDAHRPGHLAGVCQIVARLFDLVRPAVSVFGEKDWQQLQAVRALVEAEADRWPGLLVEAHPVVREPDGLALSSRNASLDESARARALALHRSLLAAGEADTPFEAEGRMAAILDEVELDVDYAVVRHAVTLLPVTGFEDPARGLVAARLGDVRLIDTMAIPTA